MRNCCIHPPSRIYTEVWPHTSQQQQGQLLKTIQQVLKLFWKQHLQTTAQHHCQSQQVKQEHHSRDCRGNNSSSEHISIAIQFAHTNQSNQQQRHLSAESSYPARGAEVTYTPQLGMGLSRIGPEGDRGKHKTGQEHKPFPWVGRSRVGGTGQK